MKAMLSKRTFVKPDNVQYDSGIWRKSDDALSVRKGEGHLLMAVSDGASSSGVLCGNFAQYMCNNLPLNPIADFETFATWFEETRQQFMAEESAKTDYPYHTKRVFGKSGSYATLTATWFDPKTMMLHWIAYGDSPIMVFHQKSEKVGLKLFHPTTDLLEFGTTPWLLHSKEKPEEAGFAFGSIEITTGDTILLLTDAIGEHALIRYILSLDGWGETEASFFYFMNRPGKLQSIAGRIIEESGEKNFLDFLAEMKEAMATQEKYESWIQEIHATGRLVNDDTTVVKLELKEG